MIKTIFSVFASLLGIVDWVVVIYERWRMRGQIEIRVDRDKLKKIVAALQKSKDLEGHLRSNPLFYTWVREWYRNK